MERSLLSSNPSALDMSEFDVVDTPSASEIQSQPSIVSETTIFPKLGTLVDEAGSPENDHGSDTVCITGKEPGCPPWRVLSSTFITIFLAEIGDKTQVSTLLMSAEFHQPWTVFLGAGAALVVTTLLGVWLGQWLSTRLSPRTLDVASGILLALISASLVWDVLQM